MTRRLQRCRFWTRPHESNESVYCGRSVVAILATDLLLLGASYLVVAANPNYLASASSPLPLWLDPILDDLLAGANNAIPRKGYHDAETKGRHKVPNVVIVNPEISQEHVVVSCNLYALFSSLLRLQRTDQESLLMDYRLFRKGPSALRDFVLESGYNQNKIEARRLLQCLRDPSNLDNDSNQDDKNDVGLKPNLHFIKATVARPSRTMKVVRSNAFVALLLLLFLRHHAGGSDAAHEVVLGVNLENIEQAENAARHRGQSGVVPWLHTHPLSDSDDAVHSILHRVCEGWHHGEGGHTGWDNAKYWAAGGPKRLDDPHLVDDNNHEKWPRQHPVRAALAQAALKHAPCAVAAGVVVKESDEHPRRTHRIIQDGGKYREVCVPNFWWDPFCFIDLIAQQQPQQEQEQRTISTENTNLLEELDWLQQLEFALLLRHELLIQNTGLSSSF